MEHILYENGVPQDVLETLANLYESAFCVPEYFELYKSFDNLNALVMKDEAQQPKHILVYCKSGAQVSLLNEFLAIEAPYLRSFADAIFDRHKELKRINLSRIACEVETTDYPFRVWSASNDVVIELPNTLDKYDARLGKNTRKNVKYYLNRIQREHQDFSFQVAASGAIDPSVIGRIIEMNRHRMRSKHGIKSGIDAVLERKIQSFARKYGLVSTISVGGRIIAGIVCYRIGSHCFGEVIAHDPEFDKSRIGQVCFYLTLQHLIQKGARHYHTLEGENDYKYRFLGSNRPLASISIYRSGSYKFRDLPEVARFQSAEMAKKVRYWATKYLIKKLR